MKHVLECTGYDMVVEDIVRSEGCYLFDSKGRKYTDFEAGVWSTSLGHNNLQVNEVIKSQIDKIMHLGFKYTSQLVEAAAQDVLSTVDSFEGKCVFLCSGSEAVEFGVKIGKSMYGDKKMLTFKESYLSAYGMSGNKDDKQWIKFELAKCRECQNNYECRRCSLLNEIPFEEVGVFVFEPGNTGGIVLLPPKSIVEEIARRLKDNNGIILVDEVTTGIGRTGMWYGFQHYGIDPDIIALGKGIGNGYPVSVVAVRDEIVQRIYEKGVRHSQSHQNDVLGCVIASEVIKTVRKMDLIKKSSEVGQYFIDSLNALKEKSNIIREVRGRGLMIAMEFKVEASQALEQMYEHLFRQGFIVGYKPMLNLLRFYPALTVSKGDIDSLIECMSESL